MGNVITKRVSPRTMAKKYLIKSNLLEVRHSVGTRSPNSQRCEIFVLCDFRAFADMLLVRAGIYLSLDPIIW